jgi:hypothetical protein
MYLAKGGGEYQSVEEGHVFVVVFHQSPSVKGFFA